ncbi:hypothetical protein ACG95P_20980, partial [Acinetobacter guillouiae]|uniref:hypothetical protein n=1 Tax=Acinetobacter guillouiae TaxID=106649 RepID=UPI003AF82CBE
IYRIRSSSYPSCHLNSVQMSRVLSFKSLCNKASRYCQQPYEKAAVLFGYAAHTPDEISMNIQKLAQQIKHK